MKAKEDAKERDNYTCQKCGNKPSSFSVHAHHIIPSSEGGTDSVDNFVTLCSVCHEYAPHPSTPINDYEDRMEDYLSTGCRPTIDIFVFGVSLGGSNDVEKEKVIGIMEGFFNSNIGEEKPASIQKSTVWVLSAILSEYGDVMNDSFISDKDSLSDLE